MSARTILLNKASTPALTKPAPITSPAGPSTTASIAEPAPPLRHWHPLSHYYNFVHIIVGDNKIRTSKQ